VGRWNCKTQMAQACPKPCQTLGSGRVDACEENRMSLSEQVILLVDDDANEVLLMERAFQKANMKNRLNVARDGQQAIDYLHRQGNFADTTRYPTPILILLDLKMPGKNGFEVLEWLRRQPGLRRLLVVVLSSSNLIDDVNRAYDLGANSYLVKPGDFATLIDLVKTLGTYWLRLNRHPDVEPEPGPAEPAPRYQIQAESSCPTA